MPTYRVTDPDSGVTLRLEGDSPPTEMELEQIFAGHAAMKSPTQTKSEPNIDELPEFGSAPALKALFGSQFGDENTGVGSLIKDAFAQFVTFNPKARIDQIKNTFPELEVEPFGDNNAIIRNPETGAATVLNKKGLSTADVAPFVGALGTAAGGGIPALGKGVFGKAAGGAVTGLGTDAALQGAEIALGSEQGFDEKRAAISAGLGGVATGAVAKITRSIESTQAKKLLKEASPSIDKLKEASSALYRKIDEAGVVLKDDFVERLNISLQQLAKKNKFLPEIHKDTAAALNAFSRREGQSLGLSDLDNLRQIMGEAAQSADPRDARVASVLIDRIDEAIDRLTPSQTVSGNVEGVAEAFGQARQLWRRAKKSEIIEEAIVRGSEAASGPQNGIKNELRLLLKNKKKRANFTREELDFIRRAVRGNIGENFLTFAGKFGIADQGSIRALGPLLGSAFAGAVGGLPAALVVPAIGQVSRSLATRLTQNNSALANQVVQSGDNALQIAQSYIKHVPRDQRSAEELAELLLVRNAPTETLKKALEGRQTATKKLIRNALRVITQSTSAAASSGAAQEVTQ